MFLSHYTVYSSMYFILPILKSVFLLYNFIFRCLFSQPLYIPFLNIFPPTIQYVLWCLLFYYIVYLFIYLLPSYSLFMCSLYTIYFFMYLLPLHTFSLPSCIFFHYTYHLFIYFYISLTIISVIEIIFLFCFIYFLIF